MKGDEGNCAAAIDGGVDDVSPVQLWDTIVKKYKLAQICEEELARLSGNKELSKKETLERDRAVAVATAVNALQNCITVTQ